MRTLGIEDEITVTNMQRRIDYCLVFYRLGYSDILFDCLTEMNETAA